MITLLRRLVRLPLPAARPADAWPTSPAAAERLRARLDWYVRQPAVLALLPVPAQYGRGA